MLFKSALTAALVGAAVATPLQHQHHDHQGKRDVKVVTNIVTVTAGNAAQPAPTTATQPPLSTLQTVTTGTPAIAESVIPSSAGTETAIPVPSAGSSGSSGAKGVTYSPYSDNGGCKSSSQISSEIAELSGFNIIRLYGVDCNQVEAVLAAKSKSQKVFAGIYDVSNIESGIESLASAVKSSGSWDDIYTVSIGNELVNGGQATASQIAQYVATGRSALKAAGYSGPVVSVDTFIAIINNPELCEHSDYIAANAHAFFDGNVDAEGAGEWVLQQIQRVSSACNGKNVMITETGWPSQGETNSKAVPSKSNQKAAVASIKSSCGNDVLLFTAFNDPWKAPGAFNAEQYWGILSN